MKLTLSNIVIAITITLCFLESAGIGILCGCLDFGFGLALLAFFGLCGVFIVLGVYKFLKEYF